MATVDPSRIPELLRCAHQWVVYRIVERKGKLDKPPFDHRTGRRGDITDSAIWMPLSRALEVSRNYDGVGFVFAPNGGITGVDLDKCVNDEGAIEPWAERLVHALNSYTEFSPSRRGLHIVVRGEFVAGCGHKVNGFGETGIGAIELYDRNRYFTVTGDHLDGTPETIEDRQEELTALCDELFPRRNGHAGAGGTVAAPGRNGIPDEELLEIARRAWNGKAFRKLFDEGELTKHNGDWSRADMALCSHLAFWTGGDGASVDRLFRQSALMRNKWDERRGDHTYGARTIDRTLSSMRAYFSAGALVPEPGAHDLDEEQAQSIVEAVRRARSWETPVLAKPDPATPFPVDVLPPDLAWLVEAGAECMSCPRDFLGAAALAVAGAAIGRSLAIAIKDSWIESAALYVSAVADPGSTKSPAISLVSKPIFAISESCLNQFRAEVERAKEQQQMAMANRRAGGPVAPPAEPPPQLRRIAVSDTTCEALGPILVDNPRGVVMVRDELTALVAGLNQYKSGGKGADRQFFLSAWSGTAVTVDRKGQHDRGPLHIPHPFLSILGAMTPDMLTELAEGKGRDDGFIDRFLFTLPDPVQVRWVPETVPGEAMDRWGAAVRVLWNRPMLLDNKGRPCPRFLRFTDDALALFATWFNEHCSETEQFDFPHQLHGAWSKLRAYCARLALILHCLSMAYNPTGEEDDTERVGPAAVAGAIALVNYFKVHTRRVKSLLGGGLYDNQDARAVVRWLRSTGRETVSERDVKRNFPQRFREETEAYTKAVDWLVDRHCLRVVEGAKQQGPGRKRSLTFEVNPTLLSGVCVHAT
ncbi:MAG: DUF3987 domain-containing protein [Isosphaeraceae bacterium]|nr:DUF3987 domain-containing protein [Isosphaeraceae bacterium]